MDEETLTAHFPTHTEGIQDYKSFIFQPERISINSRIQTNPNSSAVAGQETSFFLQENFYQFSNTLKKPVLHAKSFELLRATIPAATNSIPETESIFFYYKIPNDGSPTYNPNMASLTAANIRFVRLLSQSYFAPTTQVGAALVGFNTAFPDYQSLIVALNKAKSIDPIQEFVGYGSYFIQDDISFGFDETLNLIYFQGADAETAGHPNYYYLPCGAQDPNITTFVTNLNAYLVASTTLNQVVVTRPLNLRLGYTWNGLPTSSASGGTSYTNAYQWRMVPNVANWDSGAGTVDTIGYFPNYADLVFTQNVFIYCDLVGGSTQDTNDTGDNLLAVVPMNCSQLGVNLYESKMSCPLTKIADNFYQVRITMKTDTGENYWLPNSALVNLELALKY
jgi:hypothetical protein